MTQERAAFDKRRPIPKGRPKPDSPEKKIAEARYNAPRKRGGYAK